MCLFQAHEYEEQCGKLFWLLSLEWIKFPGKNYLHKKICSKLLKKLGLVLLNVDSIYGVLSIILVNLSEYP